MRKNFYSVLFVGFRGKVYQGFVTAHSVEKAWEEAIERKIFGVTKFQDFQVYQSANFEENILKLEPA